MPSPSSAAPGGERVMSIDALRGFDMFWIVGGRDIALALVSLLVLLLPEAVRESTLEHIRQQLNHPDWEGFSAWDMIMPLFLFLVGTSMPFAFARRLEAGQSPKAMYRKILSRVAILWVLGLAVQGNLLRNPAEVHLFCNTLHAIAVGYLVAAIALLHLPVIGQAALTAALLLGYGLILLLVPIPGHGAGVLEPKCNVAMLVDEWVLGRFRDGTTYTWIVSSLGFAATVLLGMHAGQLLRTGCRGGIKALWLVVTGAACLGLGWLWAGGFAAETPIRELLGGWRLPIIKHLFTSSMVLWAAGWSYLLLAAFYLVIDVIGLRRWAWFFVIIGMNAIFAYVVKQVFHFGQLASSLVGGYEKLLEGLGPTGALFASLLHAVAALAILWLILWYLYRKGTFLRA